MISPQSARLDRGPKADLYARVGIGHLWLVTPEEHLLEAFALTDARWLRLGAWHGDTSVRVPPFDAVELALGPLWVTKLETE